MGTIDGEKPDIGTDDTEIAADTLIDVDALSKVYGDGESGITAVDDVSFSIESGSVVGILGPNGAGKTTTIKSMLGLILPSEGTVEIAGEDVLNEPKRAYRHVGSMLEGARNVYWRLTVQHNLRFFAALGGYDPGERRSHHERLLDRFELTERSDSIVNELSRGMKQKVALASVLAQEPDVALLDEPTLGLDVESSLELRKEIKSAVEERGMTVILSSHDMDVIEDLCDRVIVLNEGSVIADDTVDNLIDLFKSQELEVTGRGLVDADQRRELERSYNISEWREDDDRTDISFVLTDPNAIGDIVDRVVRAGLQIETVNTVEPDFEDVFLELADRETTDPPMGEIDV
jgi:ABC-2 type transport system ATP-binding protein